MRIAKIDQQIALRNGTDQPIHNWTIYRGHMDIHKVDHVSPSINEPMETVHRRKRRLYHFQCT